VKKCSEEGGKTMKKNRLIASFRKITYVFADFESVSPSECQITKEATPSERETISEFLKH